MLLANLPALARHVKPNNRVRESNICTVRESKILSFSTGLDGTQSKPLMVVCGLDVHDVLLNCFLEAFLPVSVLSAC